MRWLTPRAVLFGLSIYLAVLLALYAAFSLDLPNPWWAMATVFLAQPSQPLVGAIWAKAFYRVVGTIIGAAATVVLIPNFSNSPELLVLGIAGWIGFCVFGGLLDRTPRSYAFMLAGYTAALVGLPNATNPVGIFDLAVLRAEEIIIGVLAPALVQSILFPREVSAAVHVKLDRIMNDARIWTSESLGAFAPVPAPHRVAIGLTEISLMATDWRFEGTLPRSRLRVLWALEERLIALLPLITAIEDRLRALSQGQMTGQALRAMTGRIATWIATADVTERDAVSDRIVAEAPELGPESSWSEMLMASLFARLGEFVATWGECLVLASTIRAPTTRSDSSVDHLLSRTLPRALHVDWGIAFLSALVAASTVAGSAVFSIALRWESGSFAIATAAVCCSLLASADDPRPLVRNFTIGAVAALPAALLYEFAIFPALDGFVMLSVALFPGVMTVGLLLQHPNTYLMGLGAVVGFSAGLALQPTYVPDLPSFLNTYIALVCGPLFAFLGLGLARVLPVPRVVRRILRAGWRELAALATARSVPDGSVWASRMLDRVGLLLPRLARVSPSDEFEFVDALRDLRLGAGIIELRRLRASVGETMAPEIDEVLGALGAHFEELSRGHTAPLSQGVIGRLDAVMAGVLELADPADRYAGIAAAVELRRALFPQAPAYGDLG